MRILEDDFKCGQFWLSYEDIEPTNYTNNSKILIDSFFLFTNDLMKPYTLDLRFASFDEYYCEVQDLGSYHLTTDKVYIHSKPAWTNSTVKIVPEINSLEISELYDEIKQQNRDNKNMIGIESINCYSGLYYLPNKTEETEFVKYIGSGGSGREMKRPIYQGIGIEAPLSEFNDIWAPIEIRLDIGLGSVGFKTTLNWSLYGKSNAEGFRMLREAFIKLVDVGWTNKMPKNVF